MPRPLPRTTGWADGGGVYQDFFRLVETRLLEVNGVTMAKAEELCRRVSRLPSARPEDRVARCKLGTILANRVLELRRDEPTAAHHDMSNATADVLRALPLTSTDRLPRLTALISDFAVELNA